LRLGSTGRAKEKTEPWPRRLDAQMCPPMGSTRRLAQGLGDVRVGLCQLQVARTRY
jgi:hypothetical protein